MLNHAVSRYGGAIIIALPQKDAAFYIAINKH